MSSRVRFDETVESGGNKPVVRRNAIWATDFFTADMCPSIIGDSMMLDAGACSEALQIALEGILQGEVPSNKCRQGTIRMVQALRRSKDIFSRWTVYTYWRIRYHVSRIVDDICRQLTAAVVGDFFVFPFGGDTDRIAVVHYETQTSFTLAVVSTSPMQNEFHSWNAEMYPKVKMCVAFEVKNVPKARLCSEAFWSCCLLSRASEPIYNTFLPWLVSKTYDELIFDGQRAVIDGRIVEFNKLVANAKEAEQETEAKNKKEAKRKQQMLQQAVEEGVALPKDATVTSSVIEPVNTAAGDALTAAIENHEPLTEEQMAERKLQLKRAGYATGSLTSGNLWKDWIHTYKWVLRRCDVEESAVSTARLLIKRQMTRMCADDLEAYKVDSSAQLVIRSAMENVSLAVTRNGHNLSSEVLEDFSRTIFRVQLKLKTIENDDAATQAPPLLNIKDGWDRLMKPEVFPHAECLRRLENTDEMVGEPFESSRKLPVNLLKIRPKCRSFADALVILDEAVMTCTQVSTMGSATGHYTILALLTQILTDVIPPPRGPKTREKQPSKNGTARPDDEQIEDESVDIFDVEIKYGQQLHMLQRLWQCVEYFSWASFAIKDMSQPGMQGCPREHDAQRLIVMGMIATMADATIRLVAVDHPSVVSLHLAGKKSRNGFGISCGKLATQTESSVIFNPSLAIARAAILDYHHEINEDVPAINVLWQWEEGLNFCKATTAFLRQICMAEGFRVDALMRFFEMNSSGPHAVLGKVWTEFRFYRDIYVMYQWVMAPKNKLPTCANCLNCKLSSPSFEAKFDQLVYTVNALHRVIQPKATVTRFASFANVSKFTAPLDPQNEDDILHIKSLPTFDDVIGQRDSELLLSYLTAPYIRIPLVLNFFVTEDRIGCLSNAAITSMLEGVLFEPGRFLPADLSGVAPQQVPSEDVNLIATPYGLLFNELQCAPLGVVEPILKMVALARETDAGTVFNKSVVNMILFLIRIVSRVDGYMGLVLSYAEGDKKAQTKLYRDMNFNVGEDGMKRIHEAREKLHKLVANELIPMLETWNNEIITSLKVSNDIDAATFTASTIHAHVLLLLRNFPRKEYTRNIVSMFISAMVFINSRYRLGKEQSEKPSLFISEGELFDIIQNHRRPLVEYLMGCSPTDLAFVMDSTVRVVTSTGRRKKGTAFHWGLIAGDNCLGRFTRTDGAPTADPGSPQTPGGVAKPSVKRPCLVNDALKAFEWKDETEFPAHLTCVDEGKQDVEIDLNFFSLTFKASHLEPITPEMYSNLDVNEVFLPKFEHNHMLLQSMQCANVQSCKERLWVRLVGQEHDIQIWHNADPRIPLPDPTMRFYPDDIVQGVEDWIPKLLEPVRRQFFMRSAWLPPIMMMLPEHKLTSKQNIVVVAAVCSKAGKKLAEVVLNRDYQVAHIYKILNIGRRFYRELVYTTNCYNCLAEHHPSVDPRAQLWAPHARHEAGAFNADEDDIVARGASSCVILRHPTHPNNLSKSTETFLPSRILTGIIPDSLLQTHYFWQDLDDNIRGYPRDAKETHLLWVHWKEINYEQMSSLQAIKSTTVEIYRFARSKEAPKVTEKAILRSQKIMVPDSLDEELEAMRTVEDEANDGDGDADSDDDVIGRQESTTMTGMYREPTVDFATKPRETSVVEDYNLKLLNLLNAPKDTPLYHIGRVFSRIELLSHVLCWTTNVRYDSEKERKGESNEPLTIDLILLPRLKLSFSARLDANGVLRIFSLDHAHLFISNIRSRRITELLQGLPHSLVMADVHDSVAILVPALNVVRPPISAAPYSTEIVVTRADVDWYQKLDTRYYLYTVHISFSFLFAPTLASSIYLMAMRYLHCEYDDVFRIASTIGTDMALTPEEESNFSLMTAVDERPDALACKAKISLLLADSPVRMPWFAPTVCGLMLFKLNHISLSCRLSPQEEIRLYHICKSLLTKLDKALESHNQRDRHAIWSALRLGYGVSFIISDFLRCLIYNRSSQLEAEDKLVISGAVGAVSNAMMKVPKPPKSNDYAYYRKYAPQRCKVFEARKPMKNSEPNGRPVTFQEASNYFYCGQSCRKSGACKCHGCDQRCGPESGCPCRECEAFNRENLANLLWLPSEVPAEQSKMLSFFGGFDWIETVISNYIEFQNAIKSYEEDDRVFEPSFMNPQKTSFFSNGNGFSRYYDIITGMMKVRIGTMDSGRDLIQLLYPLTRESCDETFSLGHMMHYLLNNPMCWAKLPKINRLLRSSEEARTKQIFSAIIQQASISTRYPPEKPEISSSPVAYLASIRPRPNIRSDPFSSITETRVLPQLSNTDCSQRQWRMFDPRELIFDEGEDLPLPEEVRHELRGQPLAPTIPEGVIVFKTRAELGLPLESPNMPFDLKKIPEANTTTARVMVERLEADMAFYSEKENKSRAPKLTHLTHEGEVRRVLRHDPEKVKSLIATLTALDASLIALRKADNDWVSVAFDVADRTINTLEEVRRQGSSKQLPREADVEAILAAIPKDHTAAEIVVKLRRLARQEADMNILYVISCLACSTAEADWRQLNPFLTSERCAAVEGLLVSAVLRANRVGHINRASEGIKELISLLTKAQRVVPPSSVLGNVDLTHAEKSLLDALVASISQKADSVAGILATKRCYMSEDFEYDPRFLIFEFTWNLVLRARQRELITQMYTSVMEKRSMVQQMIMGAGKTTVVGPLLAMMLANQKNLVIQVVPPALLDFSRSILRGTFSCVMQKQIFSFICDRNTDVDNEVLSKFLHAKHSRGIVVTTPSSVKSIFLKLIEGMDKVEDMSRRIDDALITRNNKDLSAVLKLWRDDAVVIMDEIDMLLHPLKSELNFPIGQKIEIDFAPTRWKLPIHLLDAVFYFHTGHVSVVVKENIDAMDLLNKIKAVIHKGLKSNALQGTPHLTLLNLEFYHKEVKPLMALWAMQFLRSHHCTQLGIVDTLEYITMRPSLQQNEVLNKKVVALDDYNIKCLNLTFEWLNSFLPHCLQKIDRVSFGIMSASDARRARQEHPQMPRSRFLTAIPFVGKDLPSQSSEFAHPDIVIGLSICAYRYEGLRRTDYNAIMQAIHTAVEKEAGRFHQRPTNILYEKWVESSGGRIVASFSYKNNDAEDSDDSDDLGMGGQQNSSGTFGGMSRQHTSGIIQRAPTESYFGEGKAVITGDDDEELGVSAVAANANGTGTTVASAQQDLLPLKLMKQANDEESTKVFKMFKRTAEVIHWYLCEQIFPEYMRHQNTKLSASGQELGGNIMFENRVGFSGTPSDLLPRELGRCEYEHGTDGQLIRTLTSTSIMTYEIVAPGWSVKSVLDSIATAHPPFHALIDTGALITGMSNLQVAQYLLKHGLPGIEGVVFLDEFDRKMILVRATGRVLTLAECGIPKLKRFAFYDQVHTTGMDIDHTPNAMAVQTLGKDMVFRDFAQGAYRMRGISRGQSVHILIIPEVQDLIERTCACLRSPEQQQLSAAVLAECRASTASVTGHHHSHATRASVLGDITAWLLVNSIRSEHTQHNQLCIQNISNVWRKEAFITLREAHDKGMFVRKPLTAEAAHKAQLNEKTLAALQVYREPQDYDVPANVPQPRMFSETLNNLVNANTQFITTEVGKDVVSSILTVVTREDEIDNPVIDVQMVQEQEEEKEAVHEIEKTQQIELEKYVDQTYSRADEAPVPWSAESLGDYNLAQAQFFHLSNFHLYKRRPIAFPNTIMLSRNFFNPKWTGHRRIKNIAITMEWVPQLSGLVKLKNPLVDYHTVDSAEKQKMLQATVFLINELESQANKDGSTLSVNAEDARHIVGLAMCEDVSDADWKYTLTECGYSGATELSAEQLLQILDSNLLREEESGRYTVAITLAEAETVRRIIHVRKILNEQAFWPGTTTAVRLNIVPANNIGLDATSNFLEPKRTFQRLRAMQCLRFVDGDLNYSEREIALLLRSIFPASVRQRQEFFLQMLSCRRRARQSWDRAAVSLAFHLQTPFDLLFQRVLGLAMNKGFARTGLHLADAFGAMNTSGSGQLSPDEIWGAIRHIGLSSVTADNILDFVHVADSHHTGRVYYTDFLFMLTGQREIEDDERDEGTRAIQPIATYGLEELDQARAARDAQKRNVDSEANKEMAAEEQRVRDEIERETMLEELNVIQRSKNPVLSLPDESLTFRFDSREQPNLSTFFANIKNGVGAEDASPSDEFGTRFWSFTESSSALLNVRSVQFIANQEKAKKDENKTADDNQKADDNNDDVEDLTKRALNPVLDQYMLTFQFQIPSVTQTVRKKAWRNGVLRYADREAGEKLCIARYNTSLYRFGDRRKIDLAKRDDDDEDEEEDYEEYYDEDSDSDGYESSNSESSMNTEDLTMWMGENQKKEFIQRRERLKAKKMAKYVYKAPNTSEENRIFQLRSNSRVQEKQGNRTTTTMGDNQLEWMQIIAPVEGYVILQQGGYTNWERHNIAFNAHPDGSMFISSSFDSDLSIFDGLKARYNYTNFPPVRAIGGEANPMGGGPQGSFDDWDDDDFGGFDFSWFGHDGDGGYDEDGDEYNEDDEEEYDADGNYIEKGGDAGGNMDTDIATLMEAVKAAHGMKVNDLVQRNPETWVDGNTDGGPGCTGRVTAVKNSGQTIDVSWPNGRKSTYSPSANHKWPVIKVGHEANGEPITNRETTNIERFEHYIIANRQYNCGMCGAGCNLEGGGFYACNNCPGQYNLCFGCFAANQHPQHEFTNVVELAEEMRLRKIIVGTCVRPTTAAALQELRSEKSYGTVTEMNEKAGTVTVAFPEEDDMPDAKWKIKGLVIVDVKSEKYGTTYMGMLMNISGMSKDPRRSAIGCVMAQNFAPAIIDAKYKIGANVWAFIEREGRYVTAQVTSCLPGGLYHITLANSSTQYDRIKQDHIAPALFCIGDKVRYNHIEDYGHNSYSGISPNSIAEVKTIHLHGLDGGYLNLRVPRGMTHVSVNADFKECFLIGDGKWYLDVPSINPAVANTGNNANASSTSGTATTATTGTTTATDADAVVAAPAVKLSAAAEAAAEEAKIRILLPKSAQTVIERNFKQGSTYADIYLRQVGSCVGSENTYRLFFETNTLHSIKKEGSTDEPIQVAKVLRDPPLPWVRQEEKGNIDDGKWHVASLLVQKGDLESLAFVDGKKVDLTGNGYGFDDDDEDSSDDEDSDEEHEENEESSSDSDGDGEEKEADAEGEGEEKADEGEETAEEEDEEGSDDGDEEGEEAEAAEEEKKGKGEESSESESGDEVELKSNPSEKPAADKKKERIKFLPKLKLTPQQILALDVRNPISVFFFDAEEIANRMSIFGPEYPKRNLSTIHLHWGGGAKPETAAELFKKLDGTHRWQCKRCGVQNSRLLDACSGCGLERVEDASTKVSRKAKIRVGHQQSKEVTDLRTRMHARLKAQMQKQLDDIEELNGLL